MEARLCQCGCGKPVPIAKTTRPQRGYVKGSPLRFANGHGRTKHRLCDSPEYTAYYDAKFRCTKPRSKSWPEYGGRGIKFLFKDFPQFIAELGLRPTPQHSLDRINNDGNYEPGNVRWATRAEQSANQKHSNQYLKKAA